MTQRMEKIQHLAQRVLGEEIQALKDPRIGFVTVTEVRVSPDLRHARVFVSVLGTPDEVKSTIAGLHSARAHLRQELGRQVRLKYLPELVFELDTTAQNAERLDELLHEIHANDERSEPA